MRKGHASFPLWKKAEFGFLGAGEHFPHDVPYYVNGAVWFQGGVGLVRAFMR
jgi:hypothetical protein